MRGMTTMTDVLASIHHPTDPSVHIPFIGARGPFDRVALPRWQAKSLADQGFSVEIHVDPYDPLTDAAVSPVSSPEVLGEALVAATEAPTEAPMEAVTEAPTEEILPDAPAAEEQPEAAQGEEAPALTAEEVDALRARITALASLADARTMIEEWGFQLDPSLTKLRDIKAAMLATLDQSVEG